MKQLLLMIAVVALVGCASYDWSSEVGTYTYDQALTEFGPPDSRSELSDGDMVVSWIKGVSPNGVVIKRILQFDKHGKLVKGRSPSSRR